MNIMQQVIALINAQHYSKAEVILSRLLDSGNDKSGFFHRLRASCFYGLKDYSGAIKDLSKAVELGMTDGEVFLNLARAKLNLNHVQASFSYCLQSLECNDKYYSHTIYFIYSKLLQRIDTKRLSEITPLLIDHNVINDKHINALVNIYIALNKFRLAEIVFKTITDSNTSQVILTEAILLRKKGNPDAAIARLTSIGDWKTNYAVCHQVGNCLSDKGCLEDACNHYLLATKLNDQYHHSHYNYADLMFQLGFSEGMFETYLSLASAKRFTEQSLYDFLNYLLRINKFDDVLHYLETFGDILIVSSRLYLQSEAYRLANRYEEALDCVREINLVELTNDERCQLSQFLLSRDECTLASLYISTTLNNDSENQWAIALKLLLDDLGENAIAASSSYEGYIYQSFISPPDSFATLKDYFIALTAELTSMHSSQVSPINQTVHGGTQTQANLFQNPNYLIQHLKSEFERAIREMLQGVKGKKLLYDGFIIDGRLDNTGSWSVNIKSEGYHNDHIHPMGQLSTVCYIHLPPSISKTNGGIRFGQPPFRYLSDTKAYEIEPVVGRILVFPSCFWHGTNPYKGEGSRLTVAADFTVVNEISTRE